MMTDERDPMDEVANDASPTDPPLQFTLRHLFAWTAWLAGLCGIVAWVWPAPDGTAAAFAGTLYVFLSLLAVAVVSERWRTAALLGSGLVVPVMVTFGLPGVNSPRPATRRANCISNLRQIGLALHNYHDAHKRFPPAFIADEQGRPMHSWRVLLLPYLERTDLYDAYRFEEPWDGPNNRRLLTEGPSVYRCPSDPSPLQMTSYVAIAGPGTAWDDPDGKSLNTFSDGASSTILVVEIANSDIHWMEPRDLDIRKIAKQINPKNAIGISSYHPGGANVVLADNSVQFLSDETTQKMLEALLTAAGGEKVDAADLP
jgi:prepilin-type processing-associated H-X9-DG protein